MSFDRVATSPHPSDETYAANAFAAGLSGLVDMAGSPGLATVRGDTPPGGVVPRLAVPTIRWQDAQERDLYLAARRARWAFDGRREAV